MQNRILLQFVCGADLASRAIAWYGNGYGGFSHVDAILPDGSLLGARNNVIQGIPSGLQIRPPNYEKVIRKLVVHIPAPQGQFDVWYKWLLEHKGSQYDQKAIWGFVLGKRDHTQGQWICSAAQKGALRACGLFHPSPFPDSQTTPNTLAETVTSGLGAKILIQEGAC